MIKILKILISNTTVINEENETKPFPKGLPCVASRVRTTNTFSELPVHHTTLLLLFDAIFAAQPLPTTTSVLKINFD